LPDGKKPTGIAIRSLLPSCQTAKANGYRHYIIIAVLPDGKKLTCIAIRSLLLSCQTAKANGYRHYIILPPDRAGKN
jgi:hypothetical protein